MKGLIKVPKIDRAEMERVIDDLETKMEACRLNIMQSEPALGDSMFEYGQEMARAARLSGKREAYQYAIDRLKELL